MLLYWLAGGLGLCCVILLAYLVLLRKQLRNITEELRKNRETDYNRRLSLTLFDRALNDAAAEINNSLDHQQMLKYTAQRAENNLRQSISDIAHDLRTPMTVIKGNLQLIENSGELSEKNAEYLSVCSEKADALRQMADTFFELSVLESDRGTVPLHTVNLTNLLMQFLAETAGASSMAKLYHNMLDILTAAFALLFCFAVMLIFSSAIMLLLLGN